jgi:hypothetical protein
MSSGSHWVFMKYLNGVSFPLVKMSVCSRKFFLMMEIHIRVSINGKKMNRPKKKPYAPFYKTEKSEVFFRSISR